MLRKILFFVFLVQVYLTAEALKLKEEKVTSQIPIPVNTSENSETDTPNTLNDGAKKLDSDETSSKVVLHPIDQIRHLNASIATGETRRSESTKDEEAKSLAEALAQHRCVPTAVNIGPCHSCVCSDHGVYFCRPEDCSFGEHVPSNFSNQPECEKNMLYNEGSLWCNCNADGLWRSANCRENFHYMRSKKAARNHPDIPSNYICEKGSYYAVDCNICECKSDFLTIASCTNRTCVFSHRADACKLGQVLRHPNEMCACSAIGYYVDKLCVTLNNSDTIQKLSKQQLAKLAYEQQSEVIVTTDLKDRCRPNTVIYRDCNRCRCTESSELVCTNKLCLDFPTGNSLRSKLEKYTARKGKTSISSPSELKSVKDPCTPGKQYRYKCNMCMCSLKGVLSCTTMICLDQFKKTDSLREFKPEINKIEKKQKLTQRDENTKVPQVTHAPKLAGGNQSIADITDKILRGIVPHIKDGEMCVPGHVYRKECNICRCSDGRNLMCSKMLCIKAENKPKKKLSGIKNKVIEKQGKSKIHGTPRAEKKENLKKTKKIVKRKSKRGLRSGLKGNSKAVKSSFKDKYMRSKAVDYPELPTTKCAPGKIYQKGCQRCFCTNRKIAQCTNRPCNELTDRVRVPKDVYPRVPAKEFNSLPELPHQAAKCDRGVVYRIDCNICLCMHSGNLLCNTLLCLALGEVNRITANKFSGKPCQKDDFKDIDPLVDCIKCKCSKRGRSKCEPVSDCTPYRMRRSLHGELNPKVKPKMVLTEDDTHCTPGAVYKQNCNNCYCQEDGSLRCTRKGCLNYELVEKLKAQREKLLNEQKAPPRPKVVPDPVPVDPKE